MVPSGADSKPLKTIEKQWKTRLREETTADCAQRRCRRQSRHGDDGGWRNLEATACHVPPISTCSVFQLFNFSIFCSLTISKIFMSILAAAWVADSRASGRFTLVILECCQACSADALWIHILSLRTSQVTRRAWQKLLGEVIGSVTP